jgi:diguanylate cyclase (GGDEF)-like protein
MVGVLVLVGWQLDSTHLKSVFPGLVAMNPVTALCFILLGSSLSLLAPTRAPRLASGLGVGLALTVFCVACLKLSGIPLAAGARVDQLLFPGLLALEPSPNRMAPNTAANFVLLGVALSVLRRPGLASAAPPALTLIAGLISYLALLGYAYLAGSLTRVSTFIPMALHTACSFLVLSVGVLVAAPNRRALGILTRNSAGGRLLRRLLPIMLGVPPVLGWLRLRGEVAGLFGPATGVALMVALMIVMGISLGLWNALGVDARERDQRRADEAIRKLAHYDILTGLPNRALFYDRLHQALAQGVRHHRQVALLFLDLDHFKTINDTLGHRIGDKVLTEAAHRLHACVRDSDTAARLGGDEFTAILTEVSGVGNVKIVTDRILHELAGSFHIEGRELHVSVSIGVSLSAVDGHAADELLQRADEALYCAKLKRNHCEFYSELPVASRRMPAA